METIRKILRGIGCGLLVLFVMLAALIMLCAAKPELSDQIAEKLHINTLADGSEDLVDAESADEDFATESDEGDSPSLVYDSDTATEEDVDDSGSNAQSNEENTSGIGNAQTNTAYNYNYDNPQLSRISVPSTVVGKNGYQPIQDNPSEIEEEEADRLRSYLSVGETGDGLTFDSLYYPYYSMLDERKQHLYRQIYANANALSERFAPIETIVVGELKDVFAAVYNDHPELFWVDTVYSCKCRANGECVEISLQYNDTAGNLASEKETFNAAVEEIVSQAQQMGDNYHKEKYVHDTLIDRIEYSDDAAMSQSAYSALVNGSTVCAGYARAMQYVLRELGVPCYYCTGYAGENHAWNIVLLNNEYYNVDVTWDDTENGKYNFFNKPDSYYSATHVRQDLSRNLPPCNGVIYGTLESAGSTSWDDKRTLADFGIQEDDALNTIEAYYEDCYNQLTQNGKGTYRFQNAIGGQKLLNTLTNAYQTNDYREAYMNEVMEDMEAVSCSIQVMVEELRDGYYLIIHQVSIT